MSKNDVMSTDKLMLDAPSIVALITLDSIFQALVILVISFDKYTPTSKQKDD